MPAIVPTWVDKTNARRSMWDRRRMIRDKQVRRMLDQNMTQRQIGRVLGVTRQTISLITARNGWKPSGRRKTYPQTAKAKCRRCGNGFTFTKTTASTTRVYCSKVCRSYVRYMGKVCCQCKNKEGADTVLMKAGKRSGRQVWLCRACANARYRKHGNYTPPEQQYVYHLKWYLKNRGRILARNKIAYYANKAAKS